MCARAPRALQAARPLGPQGRRHRDPPRRRKGVGPGGGDGRGASPARHGRQAGSLAVAAVLSGAGRVEAARLEILGRARTGAGAAARFEVFGRTCTCAYYAGAAARVEILGRAAAAGASAAAAGPRAARASGIPGAGTPCTAAEGPGTEPTSGRLAATACAAEGPRAAAARRAREGSAAAADGAGAGPARANGKGAGPGAQALGPKESEGDAAAAMRRLRDQEIRPADGREEEAVMYVCASVILITTVT